MFRQNLKTEIPGLERSGRNHVVQLADATVTQVEPWKLCFSDERETTIEIFQPFTLTMAGHAVPIDPHNATYDIEEQILGLTADNVVADPEGHLKVAFREGCLIEIPPSCYEAWHCRNKRGLFLVSVAGGGIAIWGER